MLLQNHPLSSINNREVLIIWHFYYGKSRGNVDILSTLPGIFVIFFGRNVNSRDLRFRLEMTSDSPV
jgi:hypothetical protein